MTSGRLKLGPYMGELIRVQETPAPPLPSNCLLADACHQQITHTVTLMSNLCVACQAFVPNVICEIKRPQTNMSNLCIVFQVFVPNLICEVKRPQTSLCASLHHCFIDCHSKLVRGLRAIIHYRHCKTVIQGHARYKVCKRCCPDLISSFNSRISCLSRFMTNVGSTSSFTMTCTSHMHSHAPATCTSHMHQLFLLC